MSSAPTCPSPAPRPQLLDLQAQPHAQKPPAIEPGTRPARPVGLGRRLVSWLIRRRASVLLVAAVAALLGIFFSIQLYRDLRSNIEELLPKGAPSVVAARTLGPKLHTVTHLAVVLDGQDPEALQRFGDDLAGRIKTFAPTLVESVEYRTDALEAYAKRFGPLYLSREDLRSIQERIDARLAWEKRRVTPLFNLLDDDSDPPPSIDFEDIEAKYRPLTGALAQFRQGYYQTPDGRLLVLLVRPPEATATGYVANKALLDAVKAEVARLDPARYDGHLRVGYGGEVASLVEEQHALVTDLASSTVVVITFVLLALWLYYRRASAMLVISAALGVGCALTFGISYFLVGHLNSNTAFLGSIVVGNGINVSIIFVARYLEERRRNAGLEKAIEVAWSATLAATFVASFGAGLAYLSLAVTDFRGFSQFGIIGGLGMALCWLCAYLLLPPLLATLDGNRDRTNGSVFTPVLGPLVTRLIKRWRGPVRAGAVGLLVAALVGLFTYGGDPIQYDLSKLRAAKSAKSGSIYWGKKVDQVFRAYLTPIVVVGDTPRDLEQVVATIEQERRALGSADPLREVRTLANVLPHDQEAKLPLVARLRESLSDARLELLAPPLRDKVRALRPAADLRPVGVDDLPASIRLPLTERDGTAGRIALAFPRLVGQMGARELSEITQLIRGSISASGAHAQAVGQSLLIADIAQAIWRDGPRATVTALALVSLLVLIVMRRLKPSLLVLAGLLLGVAWLVGVAAFAQVRLNFLNFVVLPITFGIGVDYAVNIVQRYRLEGTGTLDRVLRETGGAVALCSVTTIIGYSSLLVADNRALQGFGFLASLGELACLTAALVALPAWIVNSQNGRNHHGIE